MVIPENANKINHIGTRQRPKPADYIRCAGVFNGLRELGRRPIRSIGLPARKTFAVRDSELLNQ
jgi:hypothetical protein